MRTTVGAPLVLALLLCLVAVGLAGRERASSFSSKSKVGALPRLVRRGSEADSGKKAAFGTCCTPAQALQKPKVKISVEILDGSALSSFGKPTSVPGPQLSQGRLSSVRFYNDFNIFELEGDCGGDAAGLTAIREEVARFNSDGSDRKECRQALPAGFYEISGRCENNVFIISECVVPEARKPAQQLIPKSCSACGAADPGRHLANAESVLYIQLTSEGREEAPKSAAEGLTRVYSVKVRHVFKGPCLRQSDAAIELRQIVHRHRKCDRVLKMAKQATAETDVSEDEETRGLPSSGHYLIVVKIRKAAGSTKKVLYLDPCAMVRSDKGLLLLGDVASLHVKLKNGAADSVAKSCSKFYDNYLKKSPSCQRITSLEKLMKKSELPKEINRKTLKDGIITMPSPLTGRATKCYLKLEAEMQEKEGDVCRNAMIPNAGCKLGGKDTLLRAARATLSYAIAELAGSRTLAPTWMVHDKQKLVGHCVELVDPVYYRQGLRTVTSKIIAATKSGNVYKTLSGGGKTIQIDQEKDEVYDLPPNLAPNCINPGRFSRKCSPLAIVFKNLKVVLPCEKIRSAFLNRAKERHTYSDNEEDNYEFLNPTRAAIPAEVKNRPLLFSRTLGLKTGRLLAPNQKFGNPPEGKYEVDEEACYQLPNGGVSAVTFEPMDSSTPLFEVSLSKAAADTPPFSDCKSQARIMSSLLELQLLDAISGQCDRHAGNFFVANEPLSGLAPVVSIDHDMSLGSLILQSPNWNGGGACKLKPLPKYVTRSVYEKVRGLSAAKVLEAARAFGTLASQREKSSNGDLSVDVSVTNALGVRLGRVHSHLDRLLEENRVVSEREIVARMASQQGAGGLSRTLFQDWIDIKNSNECLRTLECPNAPLAPYVICEQ